jgi:uncharacterized protein YndB with AHSA1/START domain
MTDREVRRRRIAAGEARTALLRRRYQAPIQDVWDACTDPERINRWLLPVTGELRAGGTFSLEGNAHGEILRCEPPRLLAVTWVYGDRPADEVELRLSPGADGETVLELEHASVCETAPDGVSDAIFGVGLGWEPALYALDLYLRGELPDTLAAEWRDGEPPPEVVELVTQAGQAWTALVEAAAGRQSP